MPGAVFKILSWCGERFTRTPNTATHLLSSASVKYKKNFQGMQLPVCAEAGWKSNATRCALSEQVAG